MEITRATAVVDTHTGGEPTRIMLGGGPWLPGKTMGEKWAYLRENPQEFRNFVVHEPRGHSDMFGAFLTPPVRDDSHLGVIFMDSGDGVSMCGHGLIVTAKAMVELGMVPRKEPFTTVLLDTPAGQVSLNVDVKNGVAGEVILSNVPSFVYATDVEVPIPSRGGRKIRLDIAFGGNFFAIVRADDLGFMLEKREAP